MCARLVWVLHLATASSLVAGGTWTQFKYDSQRSGNVPDRAVESPLGLIGAVPLSDAVFTSPVVADGRVFVIDGSGSVHGINAGTLEVEWRFPARPGKADCGNVSSPAYIDGFLHFGTMAGSYHVLDARSGKAIREIRTAFDRKTGRVVWSRNFADIGSGGDEAGVCLMDGVLYYSAFFGHSPLLRRGRTGAKGMTAAIDPATGREIWVTTEHWMNGGCTISAGDGRLYLGGYNPVAGTPHRYVWCLDAEDGSLIWQSDPLLQAIQVVTVGPRFLFVHAQYKNSYLLDKQSGRIASRFSYSYKCTRFSLSDPYLAGSNMDVIDLRDIHKARLISTGPRLDPSDCVGAVFSNGRMFYTAHGSGLQASQVYGTEAGSFRAAWGR